MFQKLMKNDEPIFEYATCMICSKVCDIVEFINNPIEMWRGKRIEK